MTLKKIFKSSRICIKNNVFFYLKTSKFSVSMRIFNTQIDEYEIIKPKIL